MKIRQRQGDCDEGGRHHGSYLREAVTAEKAGMKVETKPPEFAVPEELKEKFRNDQRFKRASEALTPGRQRGYVFRFAGAKQSGTRTARIEKAMPAIFEGRSVPAGSNGTPTWYAFNERCNFHNQNIRIRPVGYRLPPAGRTSCRRRNVARQIYGLCSCAFGCLVTASPCA